jgi:hypothetical protein
MIGMNRFEKRNLNKGLVGEVRKLYISLPSLVGHIDMVPYGIGFECYDTSYR